MDPVTGPHRTRTLIKWSWGVPPGKVWCSPHPPDPPVSLDPHLVGPPPSVATRGLW